jgi:hypothetical protein
MHLNLEKLREVAFSPTAPAWNFLRANEAVLEKQNSTDADQQAEQESTIESNESPRSSASTAQNPFSLRREE